VFWPNGPFFFEVRDYNHHVVEMEIYLAIQ
jgi:hypothetical protein